ncbi:hypothetical protein OAP63_02755 [Vibrio sp.]|nr:hypothetical protein [Vibrio sp.]
MLLNPAFAYNPAGGTLYSVNSNTACLKGHGNCAVYPKSVELPNGRLLAAFENSVVPQSGSAIGQTIPIYKSDDNGDSWQYLTDVPAPAYLSNDERVQGLVSNWTNPYLYRVPKDIPGFSQNTILLASVVSGDDYFYIENKQLDSTWEPDNDGDRATVSIALYSSTDNGMTWKFESIISYGGWQGGSAGSSNVSNANTYRQQDPLWEPYLMVYDDKLVAFYSDENDYIGYDSLTREPILDPDNDTAIDSRGQVLVHRVWDGAVWSNPVIDVAGDAVSVDENKTEIGGGRPGMTTVVATTDSKWLMTYEYWGGNANVRYKLANSPLEFSFSDNFEITHLTTSAGSTSLGQGGSPVLVSLPDGRILYNAGGSGNIWVNRDGASDGVWTEYQTPIGSGYSRNLQYDSDTGQIVILQAAWGSSSSSANINFGEVDLGNSNGRYYLVINGETNTVLGTQGNVTDANIGNSGSPDIVLEELSSNSQDQTQYWHILEEDDGTVTLLNKSGGREAAIWTGVTTAGQKLGSWVDNEKGGLFNIIYVDNQFVKFQSVENPYLYLTGGDDNKVTLETEVNDNSQKWMIEYVHFNENNRKNKHIKKHKI